MQEVDETAESEPAWYGDVGAALARDKADEALRLALEALARCRKSSDRAGEIAAVRAVAMANLKKGDLWNAKRSIDEALQFAKDHGDKKAEAAAVHALAKYHLKEKKPDQAKFRALAALQQFKDLQHQVGEAAASNTLALAYLLAKEFQQAQELANQSRGLFKQVSSIRGQAEATYTLVQVALKEGRQDEAVLMLQDMASLYSGAEDWAGVGTVELAKAEIHLARYEIQETISGASYASEMFERSGDDKKRATAAFVVAKAFEAAGQTDEMMQCAEAAYGCYEEARDVLGRASCLEMLGYGASSLREFKKAAELFEGASFLYRQLKDRAQEAAMLNQLAQAQLTSFDTPADTPENGWQPEDILAPVRNSKRACALYLELGAAQSPGHGVALQTLAHALLNTTSHEEALGRTLESRRIFKALGDPSGEASAVVAGAMVMMAQGQSNEALKVLEEATVLAEEGGDLEVIRQVQSQVERIQTAKKPTQAAGHRVDIFVGFRGDTKMFYSNFESRRIKIPGGVPGTHQRKTERVDIDAPRRLPEQRPVLFEPKLVPATNLERTGYPVAA